MSNQINHFAIFDQPTKHAPIVCKPPTPETPKLSETHKITNPSNKPLGWGGTQTYATVVPSQTALVGRLQALGRSRVIKLKSP